MLFTNKAVLAVLVQAIAALAADNAFKVPTGGYNATAGQSLTLDWDATTSDTVSLVLRSGASSDLTAGTYIVQGLTNSGTYTWMIPSDITRGSDYTVEIVNDANTTDTNFTPYFVIDSTVTVASSTSEISFGAPTATSGSVSASTATTGSAVSSAISSANSAISSASASVSSAVSSLSSHVSGSSSSGSHSSTSAASSASSSSSTAASATGGAAMATVFPGLMGIAALAALL